VDLDDELRRRWVDTLPDADGLGEELLARWAEPHRAYHDRRHLLAVLEAVDQLHPQPSTAVRLAAWFHDVVYDVREPDNEERSARLAQQRLLVPLGGEVARLVRTTVTHEAADRDGQVLCDADLAVLGADPQRYAEYSADVRREYAHVPDPVYAAARAQVLRGFLRPRIYHTDVARDRWEESARHNLSAEIARLRREAAAP
jgi:predicted metal-dependent HD superfamily phosphohydrolase